MRQINLLASVGSRPNRLVQIIGDKYELIKGAGRGESPMKEPFFADGSFTEIFIGNSGSSFGSGHNAGVNLTVNHAMV